MQRSTWRPQPDKNGRFPLPKDDGPEFRGEIAPAIRDQAEWFAGQPKWYILRSYRCEAEQTDIKVNKGAHAITSLFFPSTEIMPVGVRHFVTFSVFPGFIESTDMSLETLLEQARTVPTSPMDLDLLLEQARALFEVQPCLQTLDDQFGTGIARSIGPAADRLVVNGIEFTRWRICEPYMLVDGVPDLTIIAPFGRTTVLIETAELVDPRAFRMKDHIQAFRGSPVLAICESNGRSFGVQCLTADFSKFINIDMDRLVVSDLATVLHCTDLQRGFN